jgi:hypothetical protein
VSKALTNAQVQAMIAEAIAAYARAQAGATTPADKPKARKTRAKANPAAKKFSSLAGAAPVRTGAITDSKFTITLGELTFACTRKENSTAVVAHTTNAAGDERYIVFRPQDSSAWDSGAYLASVARRYGLVK